MDTLDRHLIKEFLVHFVLILFGLALLFLGIEMLSHAYRLGLPFADKVAFYAVKLPFALHQFFPIAALMAALIVLSTMSRQNETLALYASGVSPLRIASTFIAVVATLSTLMFLVFDPLIPVLKRKEIILQSGVDPDQMTLNSLSGRGFWYRSGRLAYHVSRFIPETNTLQDVDIYLLNPSFYLLERIHAREAHYDGEGWVLREGVVVAYPQDQKFPIARAFKSKRGAIPEKPADFKTLVLREDTMRLRDLRRYIRRNKTFGLDTTAQQVQYHERVALVFAPLIFVLLGIPFALKPLKSQSTAKSITFCFLIVFMYLLMLRMTSSMGKNGHIAPILAAWSPNLFFLGLASFRILRH